MAQCRAYIWRATRENDGRDSNATTYELQCLQLLPLPIAKDTSQHVGECEPAEKTDQGMQLLSSEQRHSGQGRSLQDNDKIRLKHHHQRDESRTPM